MGGFAGGFLGGLTQAAQKKIDEKHQENEQLKSEKRSMYWKIAYDTTGQYNDSQKQAAQQELGKLYGSDGKKGLQKFGDIFSKLSGSAKQQGQPQGQLGQAGQQQLSPAGQASLPTPKAAQQNSDDPGSPGQATAPQGMTENMPNGKPAPGTAGASGKLPIPTGGQSSVQSQLPMPKTQIAQPQQGGGLPPIQTDADMQARSDAASQADQKRKLSGESAEYDFWLQKGKDVLGKDASPRDLAEYAGSGGKKLPAVAITKMTPVNLKMKDGETVPGMRSQDGKYYDLRNNLLDGDAIDSEAGKVTTSVPRFDSKAVTLDSAKAQAKGGTKFMGIDGGNLDLDELPNGMVLQPVISGSKIMFMPIDPEQTHITFDNKVVATDKYHEKDAANSGTVLGAARTGTESTRSEIAYDPATGQPTVNTLPSSSRPITPGEKPPIQAAPAQSQKTPNAAPQTPSPASKLPTPGQQPQAGSQTGGATLRGVPAGQYRAMLERVTPVREAATQVFGDPSQPDLKGLKDYIDLADDPKSREKLGKALRLTFDGINDASHGGNVAVGVGPVNVSAGGIGTWLQNSLGVPQGLASQKSKIMQDALKDLSPKEQEAYDSIMSAFSTVVGLRSLTRASAAQGSVSAIERELPIIGVNTQNSRQFADQMQRLSEVVYNGTKGVPAGMFDPAMVERIKNLPSEMQKIKDKKSLSPNGSKALPTPSGMETQEYQGKIYQRKKGSNDEWKLVKQAA
jgi:hypothetical protein